MLMTKRKPATVGEILTEEFMQPRGLTQGAPAGVDDRATRQRSSAKMFPDAEAPG